MWRKIAQQQKFTVGQAAGLMPQVKDKKQTD
jgi:hypothetical protein